MGLACHLMLLLSSSIAMASEFSCWVREHCTLALSWLSPGPGAGQPITTLGPEHSTLALSWLSPSPGTGQPYYTLGPWTGSPASALNVKVMLVQVAVTR